MTQFYVSFFKGNALLFLSMIFFLNSGFSTTVPSIENLASENVAFFNGDITLNCPSDITLTAEAGQTGMSASWNTPTPSTTCVNTSGCTEKTLVKWGLDQCTLVGSDKYREFTPQYPNNGGCSSVTATNVYRDFPLTYPHSCVTGVSGKAMCISSTQSNHYVENHGYAVKFSATINANNASKFSKLTFYAASPHTSFFTNGDSRANNYLRKFGVRVKRNGTVIFSKDNLPLTNDFELQTIDFGNLLRVSSGSAKFDFELMAYDPVGNGNTHRVWDLDEIKLKGCCGNTSPGNVTLTQIAGPSSGSFFPVGNTTITYRATDECGNSKDCSFLVRVNPSPKASVGNAVWNDLDNDGIKDNGEPGIANVTVKLQAPNGTTLQTTTTDNNGFYTFANLDAGDYKIMFNSPSGFNPTPRTGFGDNNTDNNNDNNPATGMTDVFTLSPGEDNTTIDAGFVMPPAKASVGNVVWNDLDNDGIKDNGEPGIANVTVKLQAPNGTTLQTTTTDNNGFYTFANLDAGDYKIMFNSPSGFNPTPRTGFGDNNTDNNNDNNPATGMTDVFTLSPGEDNTTIDAGFVMPPAKASVGNVVWNDLDNDGIKDNGEPGIANVTVKLQAPNGTTLQTTTTDNNGFYTFANLDAGDYKIMFNSPSGFNPTPRTGFGDNNTDNNNDNNPATGMTDVFTLSPGEDNTTIDAGFVMPPAKASVGNVVWNDLDNDGIKDNGEPGIANVTVKLQAPNGTTLQTTTTDNNGFYTFANLDAGDYKIMFNSPSGFNPTPRTGFGDNNTDNNNDNNPATGMTDVFTLSPGEDNTTIDAGFNQPTSTYDCPNLSANIGDSCNDGKPNTVNDHVNSNCECVGKNEDSADCNSVSATGGNGTATISNIPSGAKVEISGPATGWGQQLVCNANCSGTQTVNHLTAGSYNITVQTFSPSYCYKLYTVEVTGGSTGGGNPCDSQGGDSDGDGVCDNQDNCVYNANADQADNDGDGIGNVCDDTPNGGGTGGADCNSVSATGGNGTATISNIPSGAKVEISGSATGWGQQLVCNANCSGTQTVNNLTAGSYNITVQTFSPSYCYKLYTVEVTGGSTGGGNPCDSQGGDSDGDGVCDNQDNCVYNANADQADNDGDGIGNVCDDTPNGGGTGGADCNSVSATGGNGTATISNIPSGAKVEISGSATGWGQQLVCNANCSGTQTVNNLTAGSYNITVQTFSPSYCYKLYTVEVTGGSTGGGNPCDSQGGDSDGDGVCDNQDNCVYNANADQADNDGDGIGNVCDDTPNGGGTGGADCNSVSATGGNGTATISNIPSGAKVEISGPATGWGQQLVCNANCSGTQTVNNLTAGSYNITVQTFSPSYCYKLYTVEVTGGSTGGGNPCDSQGGDSDGDGVCDNQDNCVYNANADQADNDGDGIGNVCDDTPNGGGTGGADCNSVSATGGNGTATISNIPSGAKVEISGPATGWGQQLVCNANCSGTQTVNNLTAGSYNITVQTFSPSYCYKLYTVEVTGGSTGGGNPCDSQGGDSDGDGVCDNQDNCVYNANADQADNDGDGIGNVCDDTPNGGGTGGGDCNSVSATGGNGTATISNIPSGAKVEISGPATGWGQQLVCNANCSGTQTVNNLTAGSYNITVQTFSPSYCYKLYTVEVTGGSTGGGNPCDSQGGDSDGDGVCDNQDNCVYNANADQADNDGDGIGNVCDDTPNGGGNGSDCNNVTATGSDGKVTINNISSGTRIEISGPSTSWAQQIVCESNCNTMEMVSNLTAGEYTITAQSFNPYCYNRITVTVTGDSNPCDGQGGDSDGDGVCDNQDNCVFTYNPDQADNDGDGIGNVCDDTDPCGLLGGDSDGDGICDNQDNCRFTANSNQLDSDGDGIGDACDAQVDCNSGVLAHWDLNACEAATRVTDSGDYSEFVAQTNNLGCTEVHASNVYRKNPSTNKHSCAGGVSGRGMCVQVEGLCTFRPDDISAIRFELTVDPTNGNSSKLTELNFYASSPQQSIFGVNNYLQKMGVRVTKNGQEIYSSIDIPTTRTSTYQSFDFSNDPDFTVTSTTTFKFELLGYCAVGNGSQDKIFDIDEVKILGCCTNSATTRAAPMLDFAAFPAQREVELQWATNTGYKNDYYEIEKSTDGTNFETIQRVDNIDFTEALEVYNNIDPTPALGDNYYRVKQVYKDGSFDFTEVKLIEFNIDLDGLTMYPNPARDEVIFNLKTAFGKSVNIQLINNFGQIVNTLELDKVESNNVQLSLDNVASGFYQVAIQVEGGKLFSKKLIVEKMY